MSKKKVLLLGCGTMVLIGALLIGLLVGWFVYVSQDVEGLSASIDLPLEVKVGEPFTMTVNITNERESRMLSVSDIDIGHDYMDAFVVITTDPTPKSSMMLPFVGGMSYTFGTPIAAGETQAYTFTLRAEQAGIFRGDVDIYVGQRFITTIAQTVVKD